MSDTTEATTEATTEESAAESTGTEASETKSEAVRDPQALLNAYTAEKDKRKAGEASQRELRAELDALKAKIDGKEKEHQAAQEAQRVKDEALAAANARILNAEIRAAAKGKLADPADALLYMKTSDFEVGSDGEIDADKIAAAVDNLITSKPYLAAQGGKRFQGTADGGARTDASKPSQLTKADVQRLAKEGKHGEIEKARQEGRLVELLSGSN